MNNAIKNLNKKIREHTVETGKADETLFNFGVELGRLFEKNNVDNSRLDFFIEQEKELNRYESTRLRIESVNNIIHTIIVKAHKEQYRTKGTIHYRTGWSNENNPLNDSISNKYNITYSSIDQEYVGGDFSIFFNLNGQLKDIFIQHNIGTRVEIFLSNSSGEDHEYIASEEDSENDLYGTCISLYPNDMDKSEFEIDTFATDVEKFYTMFCLKLT
jgi:hypothetical protein